MFRVTSHAKTIGILKELKTDMEKILKDKFEANILEAFDFISWLEAKIEGKDFADVVRKKAERWVMPVFSSK